MECDLNQRESNILLAWRKGRLQGWGRENGLPRVAAKNGGEKLKTIIKTLLPFGKKRKTKTLQNKQLNRREKMVTFVSKYILKMIIMLFTFINVDLNLITLLHK